MSIRERQLKRPVENRPYSINPSITIPEVQRRNVWLAKETGRASLRRSIIRYVDGGFA
ncbi:MAG: hypothetical protein ABSA01_03435 [Anaerolineales bacterium]|jgi:hypothetical protein